MPANQADEPIVGADSVNPPPVRCRNCSHPVSLNYCANCGQHIADHNTKLWSIIREFCEEFIRFDSKFLRTMIPLILKPGFLTREWVEGKRVRYITPLKVYVTVITITFLIISIKVNMHSTSLQDLGVNIKTDGNSAINELKSDGDDSGIVEFVKQMGLTSSKVDQRLILDHFLGHLPTASLLIVPFAAIQMWFLYFRRKKYYVEHLVFLLHFNSFCFLMLALVNVITGDWVRPIAFVWTSVYLLLAIKRNYGQGWWKTILKYGIFSFNYSILIGIAVVTTAIASAILAAQSARSSNPNTGSITSHQVQHTPSVPPTKTSALKK